MNDCLMNVQSSTSKKSVWMCRLCTVGVVQFQWLDCAGTFDEITSKNSSR